MISLPNPTKIIMTEQMIVEDQEMISPYYDHGDITVTLTESQHELIQDVLLHAVEAYQVVSPYDSGMYDLPMDNEIIQRYTMIENLRELFIELQKSRFAKQ